MSEPADEAARVEEEQLEVAASHEAGLLRLQRLQTIFLGVIAGMGVVVALRTMAEFFVPIVVAVLAQFLFSPIVRWMARMRVAPPISAAILMLLLASSLAAAAITLSGPAEEWMSQLPASRDEIELELKSLMGSFEKVREAAEQVDELTEVVAGNDDALAGLTVKTEQSGGVLADAGSFAGSMLVCGFLLLFLLASHDSFLRSLVRSLPRLREKKIAVEVLRGIERDISRYLITITVINTGLGCAVGLAMALLGVPNPVLWGAMAAILNFIPYAGSLVGAVVVGLVALLSDGAEVNVLLVPLTYLGLSGIEGMLITPAVVGRRLRLRPVVVLLAVLFWAWLWGIAGALLAVPMLVVLNILCERIEWLQPVSEFLSSPMEALRQADAQVAESPDPS